MQLKIKKFKKYFNSTGYLVPFHKKKSFGNFKIVRFFFIYGKNNVFRANHAHKKCNQIYIPIFGKMNIEVTTKKNKIKRILLKDVDNKFLTVPKMTWTKINFERKKNILLVLCDYKYDRKEYIENKKDFLNL